MQVSGAAVYVVDRFGGWHAKVLSCLAALCDLANGAFPADAMSQVLATLSADPEMASMNPKTLKQTGELLCGAACGAAVWACVGLGCAGMNPETLKRTGGLLGGALSIVWGCGDCEAGSCPQSWITHIPCPPGPAHNPLPLPPRPPCPLQ